MIYFVVITSIIPITYYYYYYHIISTSISTRIFIRETGRSQQNLSAQ